MSTQVVKTKATHRLTLKDRLSRLTFLDACRLLGPEGKTLIQQGANQWDLSIEDHVYLKGDLFRIRFPAGSDGGKPAVVTMTLMAEARDRLHWNCSRCRTTCEHVGAAFSLVLEEKLALGLSAEPPPVTVPVENLGEDDLVARALADRAERARTEKMTVQAADPSTPWSDYTVTNRVSGKSYRVALRGLDAGDSFCSCPDFRTNTLGTCKHVLHVLNKIKRRFPAAELRKPYRRKHLALHLRYGRDVSLRLLTPERVDDAIAKIIAPLRDRPIEDLHDLLKRIADLQKLGKDVIIYPDAEEFVQQRLFQARIGERTAAIRRDPHNHPLRKTLLKVPLLPYQLDGVAFAAGAGRGGRSSPTTWDSARRSRASAPPSCSPARPASSGS